MAITPGEVLHSWRNRAAEQGFSTRNPRNHYLTRPFTLHVRKLKLHFITHKAKEKRESLYRGSPKLLLIDMFCVSIMWSFLKI